MTLTLSLTSEALNHIQTPWHLVPFAAAQVLLYCRLKLLQILQRASTFVASLLLGLQTASALTACLLLGSQRASAISQDLLVPPSLICHSPQPLGRPLDWLFLLLMLYFALCWYFDFWHLVYLVFGFFQLLLNKTCFFVPNPANLLCFCIWVLTTFLPNVTYHSSSTHIISVLVFLWKHLFVPLRTLKKRYHWIGHYTNIYTSCDIFSV